MNASDPSLVSQTFHDNATLGTASIGRVDVLRSICANAPEECWAQMACESRNTASVQGSLKEMLQEG